MDSYKTIIEIGSFSIKTVIFSKLDKEFSIIGTGKTRTRGYTGEEIENFDDFIDCIKKYNSKDTFFLIDIPGRSDFYQGKGMPARSGTGITGGYIDRSSAQYLADLKKFLPIIKGPYIVTLPTHFSCRKTKGKMVFPSPYSKTLRSPKPFMFGNHASTVLFSNKPLKIQVPQITDF